MIYIASILLMLFSRNSLNLAKKSLLVGTSAFLTQHVRSSRAAADNTLRMSASTVANPVSVHDGTPLFAEIEPVHVQPAIESDVQRLEREFKEFEERLLNPQIGMESWGKQRIEYDYSGVVEALEKIQAPLAYSWGLTGHLMGVKNSEELRGAHQAMQPSVVKAYQALGQSQPLFKALCALRDRKSVWTTLDAAQQRIVTSAIRQMEESGVGLEESQRAKFNALKLEASELSTKFSNNVLDSTKAFKLTITDAQEMEGLPESARALAAQQAVSEGHEKADAASGPWVLTLDMPCYLPCMQHLKSRARREQLYRAFVSRASSGEVDNAPIIKRILQIKKEISSILGYECYAEQSLAAKMAPSVASVKELTEMLLTKAYPAAQRELDELKSFSKKHGFSGDLALWDLPFWGERLREAQYEFEEEELKPYFSMPKVLKGLFSLAERLFGVSIEQADDGAQLWHPDVMFFNIKDTSSGEHIASFYLDAYSRPAEKRGGAWMDVCLGRSKVRNVVH
jgi:oligopeptidase A